MEESTHHKAKLGAFLEQLGGRADLVADWSAYYNFSLHGPTRMLAQEIVAYVSGRGERFRSMVSVARHFGLIEGDDGEASQASVPLTLRGKKLSSHGAGGSRRRTVSRRAAHEGETETWVQCDRCGKWRRGGQCVAGADWFCEYIPGLSCDVAEECTSETWREDAAVVEEHAAAARRRADDEGIVLERRLSRTELMLRPEQPEADACDFTHVRVRESTEGRPFCASVPLGGGLSHELGCYVAPEEASLAAHRFLRAVDPPNGSLVGRRIEVYWPLDASWFTCDVVACTDAGTHLVHYVDDDVAEELSLGAEAWTPRKPGDGGGRGVGRRRVDVLSLSTAEKVQRRAALEGLELQTRTVSRTSWSWRPGDGVSAYVGVERRGEFYAAVVKRNQSRVAELTKDVQLRLPEQAALVFARFQQARRLMADWAAAEAAKPAAQRAREEAEQRAWVVKEKAEEAAERARAEAEAAAELARAEAAAAAELARAEAGEQADGLLLERLGQYIESLGGTADLVARWTAQYSTRVKASGPRQRDPYFFSASGDRFRSMPEVARHLRRLGLLSSKGESQKGQRRKRCRADDEAAASDDGCGGGDGGGGGGDGGGGGGDGGGGDGGGGGGIAVAHDGAAAGAGGGPLVSPAANPAAAEAPAGGAAESAVGMAAVRAMLVACRVEQYAETFCELGWDDLDHLLEMGDDELRGVASSCGMLPGHSQKWIALLARMPRALAKRE